MTRSNSKLPVVLVSALIINALMFTAIEYMIGMDQIRLADATDFDIANFIRVAEQPPDVNSRRDAKAPEKPKPDMEQNVERLSPTSAGGSAIGFAVDMPNVEIDLGGSIQIARELTPLVRIPADYPVSALAKGIEGFVEMRFVVTETGAVADPEVLRADPPGIFDRSARRAVLKWKYQPQMVEGKPTRVVSYARLVFQLDEKR